MANFALKLAKRETIESAEKEGYLPRGIRRLAEASEPGYKRAVDMLAAKLHGKSFKTEIPVLLPEKVKPAPPIPDSANAMIAAVSTCGLIPRGNPNRQVALNSDRYFRYSIEGLSQLERKDWEAFHSGYHNAIATENPNYILPLRQLRILESQGLIGCIFPWIFALSGCSTPVAVSKRIGAEIAQELVDGEVDGCILLSA
jgi:glycine reductase